MVLFAACQKPNNELVPQVQQQAKTTEIQTKAQNSIENGITSRDGRLVFADAETFHNMLTTISKMSAEETQTFEEKFAGYTSWRKYNHDNIKNEEVEQLSYSKDKEEPSLPSFYTTLINTNREYQIGNTISYLEEGKVYFIPQEQEDKYRKNGKFNASDLKDIPTSVVKTKIYPAGNADENAENRIQDAKYQYQYNYGGHTYKQVFELASTSIPYAGGQNRAYLYINQKLEYWWQRSFGRSQWVAAGEVRNTKIVDMQGFAYYIGGSGTSVWYFSNPFNSTLNNLTFNTTHMLRGEVGNGLNIDNFKFQLRVSDMSITVPSHGQCDTGCPNPYLRLIPANWIN